MRRRSNGEGSHYTEGDYYCWRISVNGRMIVRKAKSKSELKTKIKDVQNSLEVDATGDGLKTTPFDVAVKRYGMAVYGDITKPETIRMSHSAAQSGWSYIEETIRIIGKVPVMSFETKHVRMIAKALEARPSIAQRCIRIALSAIPAQRRLLIREKLKDERFVMPKTAGVKDRVLTSSESKLLRSHLINDETHRNRWLYLFLLNTGCRIGEALAITTSSIDIQNMTVEIDAHVVTKLEEKNGKIRKVRKSVNSTKTKQSRKIHLNMDAMLAIEEALRQKARFRQEGGVIHQGDLIFCDEFGDPLDYHLTNRKFVAICNKLGIQGATQHTLRTTYATNLAAILPQGKAHLGSVILGNSPEVFAKHYNKLAGLQGTEFAKELTIGGEN